MNRLRVLPTILLLLLLAAPMQAIGDTDDLTGLWKAKKRFGPDAYGTLVIQRSGASYTADMVGRVVPVESANHELRFALPGGMGTFRGRLDGDGIIRGHWFRPGTAVNGGQNGAAVSAYRVVLTPDGANRWRGRVDPMEDTFTFYLLLGKRPDGSLSAVLRNPEFDLGSQQGIERLSRDGNALKLIGVRRGKEQDVATGSYDQENGVISLNFPSRGGTYDFTRDDDESEFYPRGKHPGRYVYRPPLARDDGWPTGTLDDAGIDRATMESFVQKILDMPMDSPDAPQFHGLLVARHGKLVLEEYFHGQDRDQLHPTRSAGKSLTSIVVGAAMQSGVPLHLSSPVYQVMNGGAFPPDLDPQKRTMTLAHLLTMSSGYFCDDTNDSAPGNEETMWDQSAEPDFYRYTMNVPMATPPGKNAVYCSASPNLALGMAGRAAHENPLSLFDRLVGGPMKIRRYSWGLDYAGNPYGGGGPSLLLRDFIKLGQLLLNGGTPGRGTESSAASTPRDPARTSTTCATSTTAFSGGAKTTRTRTASCAATPRAAPEDRPSQSFPSSISSWPPSPEITAAARGCSQHRPIQFSERSYRRCARPVMTETLPSSRGSMSIRTAPRRMAARFGPTVIEVMKFAI